VFAEDVEIALDQDKRRELAAGEDVATELFVIVGGVGDRLENALAFRADPEWKALSGKAGYTDPEIVSSISSVMLAPAPGSQI